MKTILDNLVQAINIYQRRVAEFTAEQVDDPEPIDTCYKNVLLPAIETVKSLSEVMISKEELVEMVEGLRENIKDIAASLIKGNAIHQLMQLNEGKGDDSCMVIDPDGPVEFTEEICFKLGESLQRQRERKIQLEKKEQRFSALLAVIEADELTRG